MGETDERLCDGVAEDQGLLTARSELNGHVAQCVAAAFHRSPSIDRWDDAAGSNLHEHLAGVNDPLLARATVAAARRTGSNSRILGLEVPTTSLAAPTR